MAQKKLWQTENELCDQMVFLVTNRCQDLS